MKKRIFGLGAAFFLVSGVCAADALDAWTKTTVGPGPGMNRPTVAMAYGHGVFVTQGSLALANHNPPVPGKMWVSADGATWRNSTGAVGPRGQIRAMTYANNLFVGVEDNGEILTSPDGDTWTAQNSHTASPLSAIAYGNGRWIAMANGGQITTSPDAVNWTLGSTLMSQMNVAVAAQDYTGAAFGQGLFVGVGASGIMTSPDGAHWTFRNGTSLLSVTFGGGRFVALGPTAAIVTSIDGITWTPRTLTVTQGSAVNLNFGAVTNGNGWFLACGYMTSMVNGQPAPNAQFFTSNDGATWTQRSSGQPVQAQGCAFGGGRFVSVGWNPATTLNALATQSVPQAPTPTVNLASAPTATATGTVVKPPTTTILK